MLLKSKKFWLSATISLLATIGFLGTPHILRWQVEKRLPPGVSFRTVSLKTDGILLKGVTVDKGWITGEFEEVKTDFTGKNISIDGGSIGADLNTRKSSSSRTEKLDDPKQGRSFDIKNVSLSARYQNHKIKLSKIHTRDDLICFSKAELEDHPISTGPGCFDRKTNTADIQHASLDRFTYRGATISNISAEKITANIKENSATVGDITAQISARNQTATIHALGTTVSRLKNTVKISKLNLDHKWIDVGSVTLENVVLSRGEDNKSIFNISINGSKININPIMFSVSGSETCSGWINSLPQELKTHPLNSISFSGNASFSISLLPIPTFNLKSTCSATCKSLPNLRKSFTYTAYGPDGKPFTRESGPGTSEWVPYTSTGDMPLAAMIMEDPGFSRHRGFITEAFLNSLKDNLKHGKFLRGGSTITMQLAKNLWLNRNKTLGRKIQEFFLSQALESCYSKDDIMALYLNVVEFGPNKYGIKQGSRHWFRRGPEELVPVESFWLASILPRPSKTGPPNEQALKKITNLVKQLASNGRIPDYMLDTIPPDEEEFIDDFDTESE